MAKEKYVDTYGRTHVISKMLNSGGQGAVYRTDEPSTLLKISWDAKTKKVIKDTKNNIKFENIRTLPIMNNTNVTLPQTTLRDAAGYTMKLLDDMDSFKSVFLAENQELPSNDFLEKMGEAKGFFAANIAAGGMKKIYRAYMEAACILAKIHASGLVYGDISDNNMFVSKKKDKVNVWLIDCDNLDYMSNAIKNKDEFVTTPGFTAPEILRPKGSNTMYSDAYSFAIALFWTLTGRHPFVGKALENYEVDMAECSDAELACSLGVSWIGDKEDDSNSDEEDLEYCSSFISDELHEYFQKTFSGEGRRKRMKRTTMPEWAYILAKEGDRRVTCKHCELDYDGNEEEKCSWCDGINEIIKIKSYRIYGEEKEEQWRYIQEKSDKTISVPLRIVEGFRSDDINEYAFKIKVNPEGVEIKDLHTQYEFLLVHDNEKKIIYGSTKIEGIRSFKLEAVNKKNNVHYLIDIEV